MKRERGRKLNELQEGRDMAEQKKIEPWRLDAEAYDPEPAGLLTVGGKEYPIFSFLDVSVRDSIKVIALADDIESAKDYEDRLARSIDQVLTLNAGPVWGREKRALLTEDELRKLTPRQLVTLTQMAMSVAVPQKAGEDESSASPGSSPSPAASTGGATES